MRIEGMILLHILYVALALPLMMLGYRISLAIAGQRPRGKVPLWGAMRLWLFGIVLAPTIAMLVLGWVGADGMRVECIAALFALNFTWLARARFIARREKAMPPSVPYHWRQKRKPATTKKGPRGKRRKRLSIASIEGWPGTRR